MEQITLTFNISGKRYGYKEAADLRLEISQLLDKALKNVDVGKWSGGSYTINTIEIYLKATDPDKAVEIINSAIADHWTFPLMKISGPIP